MINKKLLKPCDILLFRTTHRSSLQDRFIVWGQRILYHIPKQARYCHVALVDKDTDLVLEAKWPKIKISTLEADTYKQRDQIEVYRVRGITNKQIEKTLDWAHEHVGEYYDVLLLLTGFIDMKHSEICSTYVSKAFKAAGLEIPYIHRENGLILPDDYYEDVVRLDKIM